MGFHIDLQKLPAILQKNFFSENSINNSISRYTHTAVKGGKRQPRSGTQEVSKFYFKDAFVEERPNRNQQVKHINLTLSLKSLYIPICHAMQRTL